MKKKKGFGGFAFLAIVFLLFAVGIRAVSGEKFKNIDGDVLINEIGTVVGTHAGPGTVALFFWGEKRVD